MASKEDANMPIRDSVTKETNETWRSEMESCQSRVDMLQAELVDIKDSIKGSEEDTEKELAVLRGRVKTTATMLRYLKAKARIMVVPDLAHVSSVVEQLKGVGLVEKDDDHSHCDSSGDMMKSIQMVTDVLESLVRRVEAAESETAVQKEKVHLGEEEIKIKAVQIENLCLKLEEMERFAQGINSVLNEMRERIEELVEETTRQRQKAIENEEELSRVKREFESLKGYVSTFTNVRETLLSSERQFQTIEALFERLVTKTTQLEGEKAQKEVEVQKLMEENVRLSTLLDKKEAQLHALNEQCKVMALNASSM